MKYNWKRFWCPRSGKFDLSDGGFLSDPEGEYSKWIMQDVVPFESISKYPCLVLLGEPGIGKSIAMKSFFEEFQDLDTDSGENLLFINLNEYGDESRLICDVFGCEVFDRWKNGSHILHLFIDSLDECRIRIPQVATIFKNRFEQLGDNLSRLKLRIACRTAEWPDTLEKYLPDLWGKDNFGAFELVPLRRKDVRLACETENINSERFISELYRTETVPFAIKPVTLNFLFAIFKQESRFPGSRYDLYEKGCMLLCEEFNPNRQDLRMFGGVGHLTSKVRLNISSWIAAVSVFCRKPTIYDAKPITPVNQEEVTLSDLTGIEELIESKIENITENDIRVALGTGLFSSRGPNRMGFAHQTYAEFLAARYLLKIGMKTDNILSILKHQDDPEGNVVPQLYETSAWIAKSNKKIFSTIAETNAQILLRGDTENLKDEDRSVIVDSLLNALYLTHAHDRDWNIRRYYNRLSHSNIERQLRPWIENTEIHSLVRNTAVDIAEVCCVKDLQTLLAEIALNPDEDMSVRAKSVHAISEIGDDSSRCRMRPLVLVDYVDDPDFRLKGYAMKALWPKLIDAKTLFENLIPPKDGTIRGGYSSFIAYELAKGIKAEDLPLALEWVNTNFKAGFLDYDFTHLADEIIILSWQYLDIFDVMRTLIKVVKSFFKEYRELITDHDKREKSANIFEDTRKRRSFVQELIPALDEPNDSFDFINRWPRLIRHEDFEWCVKQLLISVSHKHESAWAELVWMLYRWSESNSDQLDLIFIARQKSKKFSEISKDFFQPVFLDSEQAKKLKKQYQQVVKFQKKKEPKVLDWLPKDRIQHYLERFEQGDNDAWWALLMELTLEDTSTHYKKVFDLELTGLPGWINSDGTTRNRILKAAEKYLNSKETFNSEKLYDGKADAKDIAIIKAFIVLKDLLPDKFQNLSKEVWAHWTPVFFGPFGLGDKKVVINEFIKIAYRNIPERFLDLVRDILHYQISKSQNVSVLDKIENIWDEAIANVIFEILEEAKTDFKCWGILLKALIFHGHKGSILLAEAELSSPISRVYPQRRLTIIAAQNLILYSSDAAWPKIWPLFQSDKDFVRELLLESAYYLDHEVGTLCKKLNENEIADLYIWLVREFPYSEDRRKGGSYTPSSDDMNRELRDRLLRILEGMGTVNSLIAIEGIVNILVEYDWLKATLVEAKRNTLRNTWNPLIPKDLSEICKKPDSVLVRDAGELQNVLVETLKGLESDLQGETPAVQDLWGPSDWSANTKFYRPQDENHFSNWIKRNLETNLKSRGIVVAREVEIRQGLGTTKGEKTDIHVTAIVPEVSGGNFEQVRVIIEAKGCWNKELKTAMKNQLVERYLKENQCRNGIYLVGWFVCDQWDNTDYRKGITPKWLISDARNFFNRQSFDLSSRDLTIQSVVLNTGLR